MYRKPQHSTITLEASLFAPLERVFSEFADPAGRVRWSPPSEDVLIYDEADFRTGGKDVFRCGPKANPNIRGETHYLLIVPNARVVSSETVSMNGETLAVSLTTLDFESAAGATKLNLIVQVVSFVGREMIQGYESGNKSALENLAKHLSTFS
jgi:uncharacterized protein YndB with AHSA1/START domain